MAEQIMTVGAFVVLTMAPIGLIYSVAGDLYWWLRKRQ